MKRDGLVKLALNSKLINKQIFRNRYQMPNKIELLDNVTLAISGNTNKPIRFSNIDLKYAYSQIALSEETSRQCNFSIVGGNITGTYRFKTRFYCLGDMPNEFQRVMDSLVGHLPRFHVYLDYSLVATRGPAECP